MLCIIRAIKFDLTVFCYFRKKIFSIVIPDMDLEYICVVLIRRLWVHVKSDSNVI